jgi:uncharacterized damage-inducible protein DinB
MYRSINEFKEDWHTESEKTIRLFEALTDDSLAQKVIPEGRTLGRLAWHIALTLGEMGEKVGLKIDAPPEDAPIPPNAREIVRTYKQAAISLKENIGVWTDEMLDEEIELYGQRFTRNTMLVMLVRHEIHHRAQATVFMRAAGLRVPGLYGPAKEEWQNYGMPPQE